MRLCSAPVFLRFLVVFGLSSLFFGFPLGLVFGLKGLLAGVLGVDLLLTWAAFYCERGVTRRLRAVIIPSSGLLNSLGEVLNQFKRESRGALPLSAPQVRIFADPFPRALAVRGWAGNGVLILSSGLVEQLTEAELRSVLRYGFLRLQDSGWIFYSMCSYLLIGLLQLAPKTWIELYFSSGTCRTSRKQKQLGVDPLFSTLWFMILLPWIRFLLTLAQPLPLATSEGKFFFNAAMRKFGGFAQNQPPLGCPGAKPLFLAH